MKKFGMKPVLRIVFYLTVAVIVRQIHVCHD